MKKKSQEKPGEQSPGQTAAPLQGKSLVIWRVIWGLIALFDLGILVFSIPGFITQQRSICNDLTRFNCGYYQLTTAQMAALHNFGLSLDAYAAYAITLDALITLAFLLVGLLIFWHRSRDRMGLFVSLVLITFGCLGIDEVHMNVINGDILPLPFVIYGYLVLVFQWPALGIFFYTFPDGRFVPRWSWLLTFLFVIQLVLYLALPYPYNVDNWPGFLQLLLLLVVYGSAVGTQIYRYIAVATPLQRQQIKWLAFGFSASLLMIIVLQVALAIFPDLSKPASWYQLTNPLTFVLSYLPIPASVGIALLRYRLWDIDTLINRTLVYGLLTGILFALYLGLVFGGQTLLSGIIPPGNGVMLVISTLLVAALFQPLRRRIQAIIDRRFYRYKYDAAKTLATFSATLQNEVDLGQLQERLVNVVAETMQPTHVSLWLCQVKEEKAL